MKDNDCCASLNYEAEYEQAMSEIEKAKLEISYLRDELRQKEKELIRLHGFQQAVVLIFRGDYDERF